MQSIEGLWVWPKRTLMMVAMQMEKARGEEMTAAESSLCSSLAMALGHQLHSITVRNTQVNECL